MFDPDDQHEPTPEERATEDAGFQKYLEHLESGLRVRFVDKWFIAVDPAPRMMNWIICEKCGAEYNDLGPAAEVKARTADWLATHPCQPK